MRLRHRWDRLTLGPRTGRVQGEVVNERLTASPLAPGHCAEPHVWPTFSLTGKARAAPEAPLGSMSAGHRTYSICAGVCHPSVANRTVSRTPSVQARHVQPDSWIRLGNIFGSRSKEDGYVYS